MIKIKNKKYNIKHLEKIQLSTNTVKVLKIIKIFLKKFDPVVKMTTATTNSKTEILKILQNKIIISMKQFNKLVTFLT